MAKTNAGRMTIWGCSSKHLPPAQLAAIETLLELMIDDEELTAADRAAIQTGLDSLDNKRGISMEDVLADLGLTMSDFERVAGEP